MRLGLTDEAYERGLRLLAILYVKENHEMYINYMARTKAFSNWLLPGYDDEDEYSLLRYHSIHSLPPMFAYGVSYEHQQLCRIWRLDMGGVVALLNWAREEIDKHAASYPQASLPFEYLTPTRVPEKISTTQITRSPGRGL